MYAGTIDVTTLKAEQARIVSDIGSAKDRLGDLDANFDEWQEVLELAATFATRCGDACRKATDRTRKQFNAAVLERLDVKDGRHASRRPDPGRRGRSHGGAGRGGRPRRQRPAARQEPLLSHQHRWRPRAAGRGRHRLRSREWPPSP